MDLIVKRASAFSADELADKGLTGIPPNWPIESAPLPDDGIVPDGYEALKGTDIDTIKAENQADYDAWALSSGKKEEPKPSFISATQIRIWLINEGTDFSKVDDVISNIADPLEKARAKVLWLFSAQFASNDAFIFEWLTDIGIPSDRIAAMFSEALKL